MAQTTAGLTNGGVTTHYNFSYDDSLAAPLNPGGPEPARTNAVIATCESDFNLMTEWFAGLQLDIDFPITVAVTQSNGGGAWAGTGRKVAVTMNVSNGGSTVIRYLMITETTEVFMRGQGLGWFESNTEGSNGEGLSRFLGGQMLALFGLGYAPSGFFNSNFWLASSRNDYVNHPSVGDDGPDATTGCALLFIWYLYSQLGLELTAIVAAAAPTLAGVYMNLTGDASDPFPTFKALADLAFPGASQITTGNPDSPYPLGQGIDGTLLQVGGKGGVWVIYGRAKFLIPDDAIRNRLFAGVRIFPYSDAINAIGPIPVDGKLFKEESSGQIYVVLSGAKSFAPSHAVGTINILWDGALAQIPTAQSNLVGEVTDTSGNALNDATILIQSQSQGTTLQLSTDVSGRYSRSTIAPDTYQVSAEQGGFVTATAAVTVIEGVLVTTQNFALATTQPFVLEGHIADVANLPVPGATVRLTEDSPSSGIVTTTTDETGAYSITLNPGTFNRSYTIAVREAGFVSTSVTISIPNGATIVQDFTLVKQGNLAGKITDSSGVPIGGASVKVGTLELFSDVAGMYSTLLDPGTYTATVQQRGYTSMSATFLLQAGTTIVENFVLANAPPTGISGTVTDDSGLLLPGAHVSAVGALPTTTDNHGVYMLTEVPPGTASVTASKAPRFIQQQSSVLVVAGETSTLDFALVKKGPTGGGGQPQ